MNTSKKMFESQTEQSHIVMSTDINGAGRHADWEKAVERRERFGRL